MRNIILISIIILLSSCRAVMKSRSSADSTAVRSSASNEKFTREIVREYLPGRSDTIYQHSVSTVEVPRIITVPGATLYRETIREAGERQDSSNEEKTVATEEKKVEKEAWPWWAWLAIGIGGMLVLIFIAAVFYIIIKIRSLPTSIINNK